MTVPGPSARWLMMDGWALGSSGFVGAFDPASVEETLEELVSSFATAPIFLPAGFHAAGDLVIPFWADSSLQDLIDDLQGVVAADRVAEHVLCYGWYAAAAAPTAHVPVKFEGVDAYQVTVKPTTPASALTMFEATVKPTGRLSIGDILKPYGATTIDGAGDGDTTATYVDGGAGSAPSTAGGEAWLQWSDLDLDGSTSFDAEVQDSDNAIAWATLVTFTVATVARGAEHVSVTGDVERYVAAAWSYDGFAGAPTVNSFIGFERR